MEWIIGPAVVAYYVLCAAYALVLKYEKSATPRVEVFWFEDDAEMDYRSMPRRRHPRERKVNWQKEGF